MKRYVLYIFMILSLFFVAPASAANFVEVIRDDKNLVYIDLASVQDKQYYYTVWEKWIPRTIEIKHIIQKALEQSRHNIKISADDFSHQLILCAYHKTEPKYETLAIYYYDKNGNTILRESLPFDPYQWSDIPPNTYAEYLHKWIINNIN